VETPGVNFSVFFLTRTTNLPHQSEHCLPRPPRRSPYFDSLEYIIYFIACYGLIEFLKTTINNFVLVTIFGIKIDNANIIKTFPEIIP